MQRMKGVKVFEEVKGCRGDLCTKNILRGREKFNFRIAFESGLDF